jgi:gas vesicle protein
MAESSNKGQSTREKGQEMKHNLQEKGEQLGHRAQETASNLGHRAQETASSLGHRAQETATSLGHRAQETGSQLASNAEGALSSVGQRISSLAGTIRENAPREGFFGSAASNVAQELEAGGRYLQEKGLGDMVNDVGGLVRSYPVASLCVGFCIGWLCGTVARR